MAPDAGVTGPSGEGADSPALQKDELPLLQKQRPLRSWENPGRSSRSAWAAAAPSLSHAAPLRPCRTSVHPSENAETPGVTVLLKLWPHVAIFEAWLQRAFAN